MLLVALCACGHTSRQTGTAASPSPPPTPRRNVSPSTNDEQEKSEASGKGNFNQYKFTYRRTGHQVVALFSSPKLPYVDATVVGAAREVISVAYGDRPQTFPRPATWDYEGVERRAIKLEGQNHEFVFVPIKDNGDIRSLVFWQLAKGTLP